MASVKFLVAADDVKDMVDTLYRDGPEAAIKAYSQGPVPRHDNSLAKTRLRDPLNHGVKGAYPRASDRPSKDLLDRLWEENGAFGAMVDQWAEDTWAEGFELETANDAWKAAAEQALNEYEVIDNFLDADRDTLIHGHGAVRYVLADGTGNVESQPDGRITLKRLEVIPAEDIKEPLVHNDPADPATFDEVKAWPVHFEDGDKNVHPERIQVFRELRKKRKRLEGIPRTRRALNDVIGLENIKWSSFETYYQRAAPILQAIIDPDALTGEGANEAMAKDIEKIQNGTVQRIVLEGAEIKTISGSSGIVNPRTILDVAHESLGLDTRIPVHILKGSAAGQLSSATEDTRRWLQRISRRQEKYAAPQIREFFDRLAKWGLLPPAPEDLQLRWTPLDEPTEKERFEAEVSRANAIKGHRDAGSIPPRVLTDYEGVPIQEAPQAPGAPEGDHGHDALSPAEQLEAAELKPLRRRLETSLQRITDEWLQQYLAVFQADPRVEDLPPEVISGDAVDPSDPLVEALLALELDPTEMAGILATVYEAAATIGGTSSFRRIGRQGVFEFLDDTPIRAFRTIGATLAGDQAAKVAAAIRQTIAQGLVQGETLRTIRNRIIDNFEATAKNAAVIARTEAMRGYNYGAREALRQAGLQEFEFRAFDQSCPQCNPLDGQVFSLTDAENTPPIHPNCRCQMVPVTSDVVGP